MSNNSSSPTTIPRVISALYVTVLFIALVLGLGGVLFAIFFVFILKERH
jgi:hypothetical protein